MAGQRVSSLKARMDGNEVKMTIWFLSHLLSHTDYGDFGGKCPSQTLGVRGEEPGHWPGALQG